MARPRSFPRKTGGGQRHRLTQWVGPAAQAYVAVANGGATLVSSIPFEEAVTLVRTRGYVSIIPAAFSADVNITGAVGVGVVTAEAFAAGVASIPEPFSDGDWGGWLLWRSFAYHFELGSVASFESTPFHFELDSKAMRKISPNEVIVTIAESQAGAYDINMSQRSLVKLS